MLFEEAANNQLDFVWKGNDDTIIAWFQIWGNVRVDMALYCALNRQNNFGKELDYFEIFYFSIDEDFF